MKKLILLLLCLCCCAYAQLNLVSVTPAAFVGTSGTFTFKIANPYGAISYYYFALADPSTTMQQDVMPPNSCTVALQYWPPYSYAMLGPTTGFNTASTPMPNGVFTPIDAGFWPDYGPISNGQCTVFSFGGGSSEQILSDGSLQVTLALDFQQGLSNGSFWGKKYLYFGSRSQYGDGPVWVGPVVNYTGSPEGFYIGAPGTSSNPSSTPIVYSGPNDQAPVASFTNTTYGRTGQNSYFLVGDTWTTQITGPANAQASLTMYQSGSLLGTLGFTLDSSGNLTLTGTMQPGHVGFWTEEWQINGVSTPLLQFAVVPTSGAPVVSYTNTTPGARYGQNAAFVVGDTYHFDLYGAPGALVARNGSFNGVTMVQGVGASGQPWVQFPLDPTGHWSYDGVSQSSEVGRWVESWTVNGVPSGAPIPFAIYPQ